MPLNDDERRARRRVSNRRHLLAANVANAILTGLVLVTDVCRRVERTLIGTARALRRTRSTDECHVRPLLVCLPASGT
jgi:hypothetical protein